MMELDLLRKACAETSQAAVAKRLGYSATVVNLVLKGTYTGNLDRVLDVVRLRLGKTHVSCPVLGELEISECAAHQTRPFSMANSHRLRMFKACQNCGFNTSKRSI